MSSSSEFAQTFPQRRTLVLIIAGLVTGMLLGAMDQTIVATAGPTIISDLGGLSAYAWVFSAYILTQTVSMPIFGKLSDLYGRRKFFMLGLVIFMAGSILSGASQNIYQLIVFRAIQGIGSGAFFPVAIAVVGVVFPPAQRGRVQGIFASVFGIAAVIGPSAGSYLVQAIDWRWVFYINLPLGVISLILINMGLKESKGANARPVMDWLGVTALTAWIVLLMLGFLDGGSTYPWYSWEETALFTGAAGLFVAFLLIEKRAKEPVLPLDLFSIRTVSSASGVSFLRGISFYAVIAFIPLFEQAALGGSIDDGRNVLYAFMLPMVAGAMLGGQLGTRAGYRGVTFGGLAVMSAGLYLLTSLGSSTPAVQIMQSAAVMGLGLGITFPTVVLAIQYSVSRKQIGIASSLAQFMGNLGGTIGLAILGTIQVNAFGDQLNQVLLSIKEPFRELARPALSNPNLVGRILATPEALTQVLSAQPAVGQFVPILRDAFAHSVTPVFWAGFLISIGSVIASLFITGSLKQQIAARTVVAASQEKKDELGGAAPPLVG